MSRKRKNLEVKQTSDNPVVASEEKVEVTPQPSEDSIVIMVSGKFIVVRKGTFKSALVKERLRRDAIRHIEDKVKAGMEVDIEEQTILIVFYPAMLACSEYQGKPFTYEEFLSIPELEVNDWFVAVSTLNPHWFPKDEESLTEEEIKKNNS